jgi:hypothetical protein
VKIVAARGTVGVPLIAPVVVDRLKPAGRSGEMLYAREPVPPPPVTGVNGVTAWFCVTTPAETVCVAVTALLIVRMKVFEAVAPFASVTVTVKVVAGSVTVGVPLIAPVVIDRLKPAGRSGEML